MGESQWCLFLKLHARSCSFNQFLIFKFTVMDYTVVGIHFITAECLLESAVTKFKDIIPLLLHFSIPCAKTVQSSYLKSTASEIDYLAVTFILQRDVQGTTQP